jgi:hypothetical protein
LVKKVNVQNKPCTAKYFFVGCLYGFGVNRFLKIEGTFTPRHATYVVRHGPHGSQAILTFYIEELQMTTGTSVSGGLSSGRMSATLTPTVDPRQQALDEALKPRKGS